jgi:hypothetical protein
MGKPQKQVDVLNDVWDDVNHRLRTDATLEAEDIEIGAVEIKDATSDHRAIVDSTGALKTTATIDTGDLATEDTLSEMNDKITTCDTDNINGSVSVSNMIPSVETGLAKETTLTTLSNKDFATQTTLNLIKAQTDKLYFDAVNSLAVCGKSAVGVAPSSNPLYVAGIDSSGFKRGLLTDSIGRIQVNLKPSFTRKALSINVDRTDAIALGLMYVQGAKYTIPTNYYFSVTGVTIFSTDNKSAGVVGISKTLGSYNSGTSTWTGGATYTTPQFGSDVYLEVTTVMGLTNDQIYTMSYTNQDGVAGRTGTLAVKLSKSSSVGTVIPFNLQTGDYGIKSVQSVTPDKANTGIIDIVGVITFVNATQITANGTTTLTPSADGWIGVNGDIVYLLIGIPKAGGGATAERQVQVVGYLDIA